VIVTASDGVRTYLDFASYRASEAGSSASSLDADLRLRDFTINAIAYDLQNNALLDPLEGGVDLGQNGSASARRAR
jgi:tRNA nucleotidyltransferase/poly(A) polymerase